MEAGRALDDESGEAHHNRRPDIVVFVNGLPLSVIELKNPEDEDATIWTAYAQHQTYKAENAILKLRPDWASAKDDDAEVEKNQNCAVKVIMTGSAEDGPDWQPQIRNKDKRRNLAKRFKDSKAPFRIVIVRDMWLTGFDAPCLHTMYADKPMQGHGLMQAN